MAKKERFAVKKKNEEPFANKIAPIKNRTYKIDKGIYSFVIYILQMNQITETTGITEFKSVFEKHTLSDYECIYVSLGSKYNGKLVDYQYTNKSICKRSNAEWQMLPGFVRCKKTLAICIDRFENENAKNNNRNILEDSESENVTIIICDLDGSIQLFEAIISIIIQQFDIYQIHRNMVIIVNYIRFISPNHTENYLEENLSSSIYKILSKTVYCSSLYEWFGYQPNLYNIIYRYNEPCISCILSNVINILQKNIKNDNLSTSNIHVLFGESLGTPFLSAFLKNTYDITMLDRMKSFYEYYLTS